MTESQAKFNAEFKDLYRRYAPRLMRVVLRRLWRGESDAEDVIQSVLQSYAGHLRGSTEAQDLWELLLQVALKHCDKHNKRTSRGRKAGKFAVPFYVLDRKNGEGEGHFEPADREAGLDSLEQEDWVEYLLGRLEAGGLNAAERNVLRLMLAEDKLLTMAAKTGLTVGRVRGVRTRILRIVRNCVAEAEA